MTEENVAKLLTILQAEYPNSFSRLDERQINLKLELWIKEFAQDDDNLVYAAVRLLMKSNIQFAPNIGQIREKMQMLTAPDELTETEAWALVFKACSGHPRGYQYLFDHLPPEVQRSVGSANQLREWGMMDTNTLQSVVASNFMRGFRARKARDKELAMIPPEMREALRGISERMRLEDGRNSYDRERTAREAAPSL